MNNSENNLNINQNSDNENTKTLILNIFLVVVLIGVIVFVVLNLNSGNEDEKEPSLPNETEKTEDDNKVDVDKVDVDKENIDNNQEPIENEEQTNNSPVEDEQATNNNNANKNVITTMTCTKTLSDEYGTYVYTSEFEFKNDVMTTGKEKTKVTLKSKYKGYRDSFISQLKQNYSKFTKLDGISEKVSKNENGFTYTITLNASKLSAKELASLGYKKNNKAGVRMAAYNNGFTCK